VCVGVCVCVRVCVGGGEGNGVMQCGGLVILVSKGVSALSFAGAVAPYCNTGKEG
jgi:hypothetical protein